MLKDHKGTGISGMVLKVRTSLLVPILVGLPLWLWLPDDEKYALGTEGFLRRPHLKKKERQKK